MQELVTKTFDTLSMSHNSTYVNGILLPNKIASTTSRNFNAANIGILMSFKLRFALVSYYPQKCLEDGAVLCIRWLILIFVNYTENLCISHRMYIRLLSSNISDEDCPTNQIPWEIWHLGVLSLLSISGNRRRKPIWVNNVFVETKAVN